ncbi:unnamed protein product [Amoebophrya sp. A25]|nr:unnamed protein product [Amoebophrya sp. A25]|eukprot:GSA25T00013520001.1
MGGCASQQRSNRPGRQPGNQNRPDGETSAAPAPGGNSSGAPSPSSNRGSQRGRDRSLRQAPVVKSLVEVENDQIKLEKKGTGTYELSIGMTCASQGFEITAMFNAVVSDPQENNIIPTITCTDPSCEFKKTVSGANKVVFAGIPNTMFSNISSPKESELPREMPLVIHVRSLKENYSSSNVNALWFYCNLRPTDGEKYDVLVLKKLVACFGRSYLLQSLFGGTVTVPGVEGDGQECVVCLSAPREVVVLHCKHVCLCKSCASVTSSTWSYQCPICRGRVAAFVGAPDDGNAAPAVEVT